jgi:hypothetical protein
MGIYDNLLPSKGSSKSQPAAPASNPAPKAGIYSDLVPAKAEAKPKEKGFIGKAVDAVGNFFSGKQSYVAPQQSVPEKPAASPAAKPATKSIYADLLPKKGTDTLPPSETKKAEPNIFQKAVKGVSDTVAKGTDAALRGINDVIEVTPEEALKIGEDKSSFSRTMKFLPSELARHLPFGIGAIISQIQDDPETAAKLSWQDVKEAAPGAVLEQGKEFVKAPIRGAANIAGWAGQAASNDRWNGQVSFNIPGLGTVSNAQFNAAKRVAAGEDPFTVTLEEGANAIFDTLFFVDLATKPFQGRPKTVTKFEGDLNARYADANALPGGPEIVSKGPRAPIDNGPKSFRLYERPTTAQPMPPEVISGMQAQGVDFGPHFNPELPTYFRVTAGKGGLVTGEIVQIRPSYFQIVKNKVFGSNVVVPPAGPTPNPSLEHVYRYEGGQNGQINQLIEREFGQPTVGQGKYYSFDKSSAQIFGDNLHQFDLPKNLKILDVTASRVPNADPFTSMADHPLYREMLKSGQSDFLQFAKTKGYDGVKFLSDDGSANWLAINNDIHIPEVSPVAKPPKLMPPGTAIQPMNTAEIALPQLGKVPAKDTTVLYQKQVDQKAAEQSVKKPIFGKVSKFQDLMPGAKETDIQKQARKAGAPMDMTVDDAKNLVDTIFQDKKIGIKIEDKLIDDQASGQYVPGKSWRDPVIRIVASNGMVSSKTLSDEIFHAYADTYLTEAERQQIFENIKGNVGTVPNRIASRISGYSGDAVLEEFASNDFANYVNDKNYITENKGLYQKMLDGIRGKIRTSTGLTKIYEDIVKLAAREKPVKPEPQPAYTPASSKLAEAFAKSKNQTPVHVKDQVDFYLGTFGRNHMNRKTAEAKADRFPEAELPATIDNIKAAYRASSDPTNYRYDNVAYVSKMPDDEVRIIYTRKNAQGHEEIINWHKVSDKKYVVDLSRNGTPGPSRTGKMDLEGPRFVQLAYGDKTTLPTPTVSGELFGVKQQDAGTLQSLSQEAQKYGSAAEFAKHFSEHPHEIPISKEYQAFLDEHKGFIARETEIYARMKELRDKYKNISIEKATPDQLKQEKIDRKEYTKIQEELKKLLSKKTMADIPEGVIKTHIGEKALKEQLVEFYNEAKSKPKGVELPEKITKAYDDIEKARELMKKAPESSPDYEVKTKGDYQSYIDDVQRYIDKRLPAYTGGSEGADIGTFRDGTPVKAGGMENIKPIELPEMVQIARELMGQAPKVKKNLGKKLGYFRGGGNGEIVLRADIFKNLEEASKTLAHEIGHLVDYLPDLTLKRGNLLGRLLTLNNFRKDVFEDIITTNAKLRAELTKVSEYWRPYDKKHSAPSYLRYRNSAKEIYADAISMLFNSPGLLEEMAPTFYHEFFNQLDKKPMVRDAFFEAQALLSGDRLELIKARRAGVQQMFRDGDYKAIELQNARIAERETAAKDYLFFFKFNLIDKNYPLINRINQLKKEGKIINPDDNPVYYLEERNYLGGRIKAMLEKDFAPIYKDLTNVQVSWTTLGEALFYERIAAGDRSEQANPRGITKAAATELLSDLYSQLTGHQTLALRKAVSEFRDAIKAVAEEAFQEGLYSKELYDNIKDNPAYASFQVIDHLEDGMSSKIYKSIGTLKDITNPADASILKTIATVRAIEHNKVKKISIDFLSDNFKGDVEPAKKQFTGKAMRYIESKNPKQELITFMRGGKAEGYYVDPYVAVSLNNESIGQNRAIMTLLSPVSFLNKNLFRPLFIGFNLGFQSFNALRDFQRFWKNIPDMTLYRAVKLYTKSLPLAKARAFGTDNPKLNETLQMLEEEKVFSTTFTDMIGGKPEDEAQIDMILRNSGIESFTPEKRNAFLRPFVAVLDFVQKLGNFIETLPKAAGFYELSAGGKNKLTMDQKSYIRRYLGSPDFLAGGYIKRATNEIFIFSNAITQGIRSDLEIATQPGTRGAYWWKTAKVNFLPKILMLLASLGFFGAVVKKIMDDASEYDKTNYTIIPLGVDSNGKSIYFRLPADETGRLFGGLTWKGLNLFNSDNKRPLGKDLADILSFTGGQIPNVAPSITTPIKIYDYLSGQNPYDSFRGRNVLSDDVFHAGGWRAHKAMLGWVFNQLGGGIFYRFTTDSQVPQPESGAEKVFNLPVLNNIVGRFFRVTDYGTTEKLNQIKANVESQAANNRLDEKDLVNKYVKEAMASTDLKTEQRALELKLVRERFDGEPKGDDETAAAKRLVTKFRTAVTKSGGDAVVNALMSAVSNAQKIEIIKEVRPDMTDDEYLKFKQQMIREKVASGEVFSKAEKD